jgi:hypothetical protein
LHLIRKTAWSNESLVGCRVSILVENKEWHEGLVIQFHKSGKHRVEFRTLSDRRWLHMNKHAFYILDRPVLSNLEIHDNGEVKEHEDKWDSLAPMEVMGHIILFVLNFD